MSAGEQRIIDARRMLDDLNLPGRRNDVAAAVLASLAGVLDGRDWSDARRPMLGTSEILGDTNGHTDRGYAPNTRETFRKAALNPWSETGIVLHNPDNPARPTNSGDTCYQISVNLHHVVSTFGSETYPDAVAQFLSRLPALQRQAQAVTSANQVTIATPGPTRASLRLGPGSHNQLQKAIVEQYLPRFAPEPELLYLGDTSNKHLHEAAPDRFRQLRIPGPAHGKLPDVVALGGTPSTLHLIEAVDSHGEIDKTRALALRRMYEAAAVPVVLVNAFLTMCKLKSYVCDRDGVPKLDFGAYQWVADYPDVRCAWGGGLS